jgi:hypothetical protein
VHEDLPSALREFDLDALVGLTVDEARSHVESAGGRLRVYRDGQALPADLRTHRITAKADGDRVVSVLGFG